MGFVTLPNIFMLKLNEYGEVGCLAGLIPSHRIANRISYERTISNKHT